MVILKDASQRRSHEGLAQPDDIPDEDAIPLVQMVGRDLDGRSLEIEEAVPKHLWDLELREAGTSLVREVIRHLEVDVVRRD